MVIIGGEMINKYFIICLNLLLSVSLIAINIYIMSVNSNLIVQIFSFLGGWIGLVLLISFMEAKIT